MKENIAAEVDQTLRSVYSLLEKSIHYVNENCSKEDAYAYRQSLGKIFYILIFNIWEPLYQEHPALKPADWDDQKTAD